MDQTHVQCRSDSQEPPGNDGICELRSILNLVVLRYEGGKCEGQFDGEGAVCFDGGHMYKGMFSKGLMDGTGVFTHADGLKYEGEFVCNKPMGKGTYTWPDGSCYKGEVYNGVRHGMGDYKCAKNGMFYEGQWHHGKRHGKGTVYYNDKKTSWYKGDWVNNNREGLGDRCYPSGNIYSGEWKNNLRHGEGTMKWLKLGQQYVGEWQDGVQHGKGTHIWILRRVDGSQYPQSNQYNGDFNKGQRHGKGTFCYAGGAKYVGEWKDNRKHGQGEFICKDGRVFKGEFVNDKMMTPNYKENRVPSAPGAPPLSDGDPPDVIGQDIALNIESLLNKFPERKRRSELHQVEFVVLRQDTELRSIYSFYSRLGQALSPDNTFLLSRMQLWRLLKDCHIHHHGVTLTQIDRLIRGDGGSADIHCPFTPVLLCNLLNCLVIVAYHIYSKDMMSQKNILAACLSKLMSDNILPNAKNVKGFLFRQPGFAVAIMQYVERCWEVYQVHCSISAATKDDGTMTHRHLLWMFKDLHLVDDQLTTMKLLEIITAESSDPTNRSSCLDLEITFLEFFEVLLGCAEVKCLQVPRGLEEARSQSECDSETRRDPSLVGTSETLMQSTHSTSQSFEDYSSEGVESQHVQTGVIELPLSAGIPEEHESKENSVKHRTVEAKNHKVEVMIQTVHQFCNHYFFPAFEHHQLLTANLKEEKTRQEAQRHITLLKAQENTK